MVRRILSRRLFSTSAITVVLGASLLLIVFPIYVNQVGIALASPLTVRVVLAVRPVLIFVLQLVEARLSSSAYLLAAPPRCGSADEDGYQGDGERERRLSGCDSGPIWMSRR